MRLTSVYNMRTGRIWARVSNGTACFTRDYTAPAPVSSSVVHTIGRSREIVRGNKVKATPYSMEAYEVDPITGSYTSTSAVRYGPKVNHTLKCGPEAGTFYELSGDAGIVFEGKQQIPVAPVDQAWEQFLMDYANTQALSSLTKGFVNIPLLYAERKETLKLITDKSKLLSAKVSTLAKKATKDYKRAKRDGVRAKEAARRIAEEHLAFLFGVLPLIDEISGAVEMFYQPESMLITGRGKRANVVDIETSFASTHTTYDGWLTNYQKPSLRCKVSGFDRISARTSVTMEVSTRAMSRLRQLGFNPLAASFDLVPLSFLANFVSNLGSWVGSHDPMPDAVFLRGSVGLWREAYRDYTVVPEPFKVFQYTDTWVQQENAVCNAKGSARALKVERFPFDGLPDPTLLFANNLSIAKAFTVSALAIQRAIKPVVAARRALKAFRYVGPRPKNLKPIEYEP